MNGSVNGNGVAKPLAVVNVKEYVVVAGVGAASVESCMTLACVKVATIEETMFRSGASVKGKELVWSCRYQTR